MYAPILETISLLHHGSICCHLLTHVYSRVVDYTKFTNPATFNIREIGGGALLPNAQSTNDMLTARSEGVTINTPASQTTKTKDVNDSDTPTEMRVGLEHNSDNEMDIDEKEEEGKDGM